MERHSVAGGIMKDNRTRTQKLLAAVKRGQERRKLSAEEEALVDAMRRRVEAEERAGAEMVDVISDAEWLEQATTLLTARPELWKMLQAAMKKPNRRPNEEPDFAKEWVRQLFDDLTATKWNREGMGGNDAMHTLAARFGVPFGKIKNIIYPPKSRKRTP